MIYAFTSAALNYLPKARLCLTSLRRFHPEFRLVYALADRLPPDARLDEACIDEILPVEDLPPPISRSWIFQHSIVELSTGIKPFVVQALLERPDCDAVLYFDPDIVLFSRLDEVVNAVRTSDIVLTPHQLDPDSRVEAIIDNEIGSLKYGIYNFGFFGVRRSEEGCRFAKWWGDRLYLFCQERLDLGLWTDQKWINHVPVFFSNVSTIKEPRLNVAPWNLTTRVLHGATVENTTVSGQPLGFYHFTGFDSGAHRIMATKYGGDNHAVMKLVEWYERATEHTHEDALATVPWAYARYSNGIEIAPRHRSLYRERRDLREAFPDPFEADTETNLGKTAGTYLKWLQLSGEYEDNDDHGALPRLGQLEAQRAKLEQEVRRLKQSLSWRLTRPLRFLTTRKATTHHTLAAHEVVANESSLAESQASSVSLRQQSTISAFLGDIPGWLSREAADFTTRIIAYQDNNTITGPLLEIGVFKGKYLALLYGLTMGTDERVVGVDGFFARAGVPLSADGRRDAIEEIRQNVSRFDPDLSRLSVIPADSRDMGVEDLRRLASGLYRFISVDAGHDADSVYQDAVNTSSVLHEDGVIAFDDVFNAKVPGVAEGLFRFLASNQGQTLAAFAHCGNKLFVTTERSYGRYLKLARATLQEVGARCVADDAMEVYQANVANNFRPEIRGRELVVLTSW